MASAARESTLTRCACSSTPPGARSSRTASPLTVTASPSRTSSSAPSTHCKTPCGILSSAKRTSPRSRRVCTSPCTVACAPVSIASTSSSVLCLPSVLPVIACIVISLPFARMGNLLAVRFAFFQKKNRPEQIRSARDGIVYTHTPRYHPSCCLRPSPGSPSHP